MLATPLAVHWFEVGRGSGAPFFRCWSHNLPKKRAPGLLSDSPLPHHLQYIGLRWGGPFSGVGPIIYPKSGLPVYCLIRQHTSTQGQIQACSEAIRPRKSTKKVACLATKTTSEYVVVSHVSFNVMSDGLYRISGRPLKTA